MKRDEGTAVIELALVLVILLGLVIGTYEYGTAFAEKTAMATAVREGARAGSAAADFDIPGKDADCIVIEAAAGALQGMDGNDVTGLWIYKTDSTGEIPLVDPEYQYYVPDDLDIDLTCGGGNWNQLSNSWPPSERGAGTDQWLGVKVSVSHQWKTGFAIWNGTTNWEERAVMRLEPDVGQ